MIREAGEAERRALLDVLARAFLENPMNRALHSSHRGRRLRANRAGLRHVVLDEAPGKRLRVAVSEIGVVGGYVALRPGAFPLPPVRFRRVLDCFWNQGPSAVAGWGEVNHEMVAIHPTFDHWYLCVLGVSPECWGTGVGSQLLRDLEAETANEPAPIYLESDRAESVAFYRARGFRTREEIVIRDVRCTCLLRPIADK